ncbi:MAG: SDR family NAD(P)-dependent oxidoreductase [Oscillospiraceae bacterium]|nr:SDR family NAD(P)-dependent oxidoreductase [Oscillospiraceae bacterium]
MNEKHILACKISPVLRMLYNDEGLSTVSFYPGADLSETGSFRNSNDIPLIVEKDADLYSEFAAFIVSNGFAPKIVSVMDLGVFKIADTSKKGRLAGKITIVTGGAQGFGKGIAESMAAEGAYIVVADLNLEGALACAGELNRVYGEDTAVAVQADVSDEASALQMVQETVLAFGGLDVLVSNAGILIAGSLSDLSKENFELVTKVNYTGYFLCAKYASEIMKLQRKYAPSYLMDIIEINSKSGLEGSNKNFAYSGSKFGGIGLTQSFAMELIEYGIKVNAICPGNLLDGPLWSDPERGLFRQYLDSGKVEGAKTIEDVRKFYEAKVPMGRGCEVADVTRAIYYVIEQKYETGQAIPVTGGQVMLK